jgi:NAD-dependent SIR2 family protein deacetylase
MIETSSLQDFVDRHRRLFVLTGAGCSTGSGIPDYRDADGQWKRPQPVTFQAFMGDEKTRRRYWARGLIGWRRIRRARPNDAHRALARLETMGRIELVLTQNVDRLHQAAGNARVIDLHGRIDLVRCMDCELRSPREELQDELGRLNSGWLDFDAAEAPDGDADLDGADFSSFALPSCRRCGGVLKPDVVFFGENVPPSRVAECYSLVERAGSLVVLGSSLTVMSGFRFVRHAARHAIPVMIVNHGPTRGDAHARLKLDAPLGSTLTALVALVSRSGSE